MPATPADDPADRSARNHIKKYRALAAVCRAALERPARMRTPHVEPAEHARMLARFAPAVQDLAYRVESTHEIVTLTDDTGRAVAAVIPAALLNRVRREARSATGGPMFTPPVHSV